MRILIACEYSGRVRAAFRSLGHDAWSADLPAEDNGPHIQVTLPRCSARSRYGKAHYHAASRGAGSITLGPDPRSALWLSFAIVKV